MAKTERKRDSWMTVEFLHDGRLAFKFNGVSDGRDTLIVNPTDASVENQARMRALGCSNTLRDAGALSVNPETGERPTIEAKRDAVEARWAWLGNKENLDWTRKGASVRDGYGDIAGLVFQACMRHFGDTDPAATEARIAKVQAKRGLADRATTLRELGKVPAIVKIVGDIKAERAQRAAQANAADMLNDMADDDEDDTPASE